MQDELNIQTPRRVDPSSIDRELRKMWSQASADPAHPVIRARILNLAIFVDAHELAETSDAAAELAARHPSRTIIAAMDPGAAESRLNAEVSARCTISFGRRQQICSEQIVITAEGRSVDDVHGLVAPLLSSDLRTYLWWRRAGWPSGHSFDVLADHCDRILLDSARFVSGATELGSLLSLIRKFNQRKPSPLPIGDLNWTRLGVWRTSLASLYDVPLYRERLGRLTTIRITYLPSQVGVQAPGSGVQASAGPPDDLAAQHSAESPSAFARRLPAEPLLIAGWLASRLGWTGPQKPAQGGSGRDCVLRFSNPAATEMVLSPAQAIGSGTDVPRTGTSASKGASQASRGVTAISAIQFDCDAGAAATFSVRFKDSCLETKIMIDGQTQAGRVVACDDKPDGQLVAEELDILGNDVVYENALQMASILAALL
jgi:glucose-6-phosphate dehydrogenase assembly protein OpcA